MISACSSLSTSFRKSMSGSRIEDGCDALFLIAFFRSCGVKNIIKTSVFFVFFYSCVVSEYAFLTNVCKLFNCFVRESADLIT